MREIRVTNSPEAVTMGTGSFDMNCGHWMGWTSRTRECEFPTCPESMTTAKVCRSGLY